MKDNWDIMAEEVLKDSLAFSPISQYRQRMFWLEEMRRARRTQPHLKGEPGMAGFRIAK